MASGIGISIVPLSVARMRTGDVSYIPFKENQLMRSNVVMTYRTGDMTPELHNFVKRVHLLSGVSRQRKNMKKI